MIIFWEKEETEWNPFPIVCKGRETGAAYHGDRDLSAFHEESFQVPLYV